MTTTKKHAGGAIRSAEEKLKRIQDACEWQAQDRTLWSPSSIGEAYVTQSLRWLHELIEDDSDEALKSIEDQSEDRT